MKRRTFRNLVLLGLVLMIGIPACDVLNPDPTATPVYVTATPQFIIVTNTHTPSPSPVLAPTINRGGTQAATSVAQAQEPTEPPLPTVTATTIITSTPTFTPTPSNTPSRGNDSPFQPVGVEPGDVPEGVDPGFILPGQCTSNPEGGFNTVYSNNPDLAAQLGCATSSAVNVTSAYQPYERGLMIWVSSQGAPPQSAIYALYSNNTYQAFADTWREGIDPESSNAQPPSPNLFEPIRGFGKVWREAGGVQQSIGWATSGEQGGSAVIQQFERGTMLYLSQTGQTYIMIAGAPGSWSSASIAY